MRFINFLVVKLAVSFAAGIILGYFSSFSFSFILKLLCFQLLLLLVVRHRERNTLRPGVLFGIIVYGTFFTLGLANYQLRQPENSNRHYTKFLDGLNPEVIQLKITRVLKSNSHFNKFFAEVVQYDHEPTQGKILVSIPKDSVSPILLVDDLLLAYGKLENLKGPLNPYQFDYQQYLKHQEVHHQLRLSRDKILSVKKGATTPVGLSNGLRGFLIKKLSEQPIGDQEQSIIQALLLGERSAIEKDLYSQYAAAGALHILAVSGLHVGILFIVLSRLFSPLERFKKGKSLKIVSIVLLLWCFALLAGLSASVVRAVTMFSLFAVANSLRRPSNGFNTLFLSFLILLIANPDWLFHVGFQFSYLAVFFILWVQPKLYELYIPKYFLDKQLWSIFTVTLAAQLGIAPLSIFYFHQFPGLFFLSNLVILPFLGIILTGGILVIILSAMDVLPASIAIIYNELIRKLNDFITWVAQQEAFLFKDISFSAGRMLANYLIIIALTLLLFQKQSIQKKTKQLKAVLVSLLVLMTVILWENKTGSGEEFIVFHVSRNSVIGHRLGSRLRLLENDSVSFANRFPVKDYHIGNRASVTTSESIPDVFSIKGKTFLRIDNLAVFPSEEIDIVLITQSPKIHLARIIDSLKPKTIIADGSNYPWDVERWRKTCVNRNQDFYYTGTKGAFVLK